MVVFTTVPKLEVLVLIAMAAAFTVMVCSAVPTERVKSKVAVWSTSNVDSRRVVGAKPSLVTSRVYRPGRTLTKTYRPVSVVRVFCRTEVPALIRLTRAAGIIAPLLSRIVPLTAAVAWPKPLGRQYPPTAAGVGNTETRPQPGGPAIVCGLDLILISPAWGVFSEL